MKKQIIDSTCGGRSIWHPENKESCKHCGLSFANTKRKNVDSDE